MRPTAVPVRDGAPPGSCGAPGAFGRRLPPGPSVAARFFLLVFFVSPPLAQAADAAAEPPIDLAAKAVQVAGYLLIFIVLAALAVHLAKRYQPTLGGSGPIHIVDGRNLAPGVGVRLVRVGSRAWLLGVTRDRISMLAELPAHEVLASGQREPRKPEDPPS